MIATANKTKIKLFLTDMLLMAVGGALCAIAINGFLRPHELMTGGMAGISLIIYYNWQGIPFSIMFLIVSSPVFLLGYFIVGRKFIMFSVLAVLIHTAMFQFVNPSINIDDKLLSALMGGALSGAGVAMILRTNGTHSGTEIISIMINRFYSINLSTTNMIINAFVLLGASFFMPLNKILYSLIFVIMNAQVMNSVFKGMAKRKAVMIISKQWRPILDNLSREKRIGTTLLSAKGGYTGSEEPILFSIIKSRHVSVIRTVATGIDPAAFIVVMETTDIINDTIGNQPPWKKQLYKDKKNQ